MNEYQNLTEYRDEELIIKILVKRGFIDGLTYPEIERLYNANSKEKIQSIDLLRKLNHIAYLYEEIEIINTKALSRLTARYKWNK